MYYPKSQATTNLYTNGDEFILKSNLKPYVGYYWKTSRGTFFAGKTPQSVPLQEIIPVTSKQASALGITPNNNPVLNSPYSPNDFFIIDYPKYTYIDQIPPTYSPNIPTEKDYSLGEYVRYFCKKVNEILYIEISKDTYNKITSKDPKVTYYQYQPFYITWRLVGEEKEVYKINKNSTELVIKQYKLSQFDLYLKKDYTKYGRFIEVSSFVSPIFSRGTTRSLASGSRGITV